ncbi:toll/interleukin-1 receptor domain-containing protein [Pseudomonas nitroreducens]|uniref:toll/interleukin-1 receptor domain-containing protein n=1 Tax=Pseudomonas nitroreducens TaxID=46680 RepID=UPI003CC8156A
MAISLAEFNRRVREAQRKAEQQLKREIDRANRENKRLVDAHNRKVDAHNKRVVAQHNAAVNTHNRRVSEHNRKVIAELNRSLRSATSPVRYTDSERQLVDRVHQAVATIDTREYDSFLSYARIDGAQVANELRGCLEELGVAVWFDEVAIVPGRSQSLQMDAGLRKARTGIALLTPAYLTGRFWTERELGVLLSKSTLIPVLHNVTFDNVKEYSSFLPDLAGFTTEHNSVAEIAEKIAAAVLPFDE